MKVEITYDSGVPLQVVPLENGKLAYIIDTKSYDIYLSNFPARGSVVLEKRT